MAIIACHNCGKKVTDRMEECPHCHAVLIEKAEKQKVNKPILSKEVMKASVKGNIIYAALATFLTTTVVQLGTVSATIIAGKFLGTDAATAVVYAKNAFFSNTFLLLLLAQILLGVWPVLFKQLPGNQFLVTLIASVLLAIIGWAVQHHAVLQYKGLRPELMAYLQSLSIGFGAAFPLLWGSLSVTSYKRTIIKALITQVIWTVVFVISSVILDVLMLIVFKMGTRGISIGNLISAIFVFALALLTNKEFQQLITPKKLA